VPPSEYNNKGKPTEYIHPMSRIKLDDRIENAMNAFFETEPDGSHFALTYTGDATALVADETTFAEKADKWTRISREVLLFGPGTFLLFYATLAVIFFYPAFGVSFQSLLMILVPAFLTYAGVGSLMKIKNLAVPATVIVMAAGVAFIASLFPTKEQPNMYFWYSIYLFPNALIAGKLVQGWVSAKK